ncbi:hypothetical protein ACE193_03280 [Bernardetia sp. OM2101]|uniref:hypothetical protein n=1 Tax=Bernardetia sp. OM2101 TaxID=3344876 RepID=UPI0035D110B4
MLLFSFSLFSCDSEDITTDSNQDYGMPNNSGGMLFVIADYQYNNLFKDTKKGYYDMDYVYLITADGKYRDNLGEQHLERSIEPIYKGWAFISPLLAQISSSGIYEKKFWKTEYVDKPLYLHLSPTDIDTLMWSSEDKRLHHNGKLINKYNAILKDVKN